MRDVCYEEELPLNAWTRLAIGQVPSTDYPFFLNFKVYVNSTVRFEHENLLATDFRNVSAFFTSPLDEFDVAIAQVRSFVHSAAMKKVGIRQTDGNFHTHFKSVLDSRI